MAGSRNRPGDAQRRRCRLRRPWQYDGGAALGPLSLGLRPLRPPSRRRRCSALTMPGGLSGGACEPAALPARGRRAPRCAAVPSGAGHSDSPCGEPVAARSGRSRAARRSPAAACSTTGSGSRRSAQGHRRHRAGRGPGRSACRPGAARRPPPAPTRAPGRVAVIVERPIPGSDGAGELVKHLPQRPHPARRSPNTGYVSAGSSKAREAWASPRNASEAWPHRGRVVERRHLGLQGGGRTERGEPGGSGSPLRCTQHSTTITGPGPAAVCGQTRRHSGRAAAVNAAACWPTSRRVSQDAWMAACSIAATPASSSSTDGAETEMRPVYLRIPWPR